MYYNFSCDLLFEPQIIYKFVFQTYMWEFPKNFLLFISDLVWIWLRTFFVTFHYFKIIKSCWRTFRTWFVLENAYVYLREMLFGMFYKYQLSQLLIIIFVSYMLTNFWYNFVYWEWNVEMTRYSCGLSVFPCCLFQFLFLFWSLLLNA